MDASKIVISNSFAPEPLLSGNRDTMTFAVHDGGNVPEMLAGQYARLAYKTLGELPVMLRQFDFSGILSDRNLIVLVCEGDRLLSGAYAVREVRGGRPTLVHKGYVSSGKGLAKVMIAALHFAEERRTGWPVDGEAVARVMRSGDINQASSSPFADAGFHGVRNFWSQIGNGDIHLMPFAEERAEGYWIGSHLMAGRGDKIAGRAREILSDWTVN